MTGEIDRNIRRTLFILTLVGFLDAVYLSILKLAHNPTMCIKGVGDCWSVNISVYSENFGIPIAVLGSLAFLTIALMVGLEDQGGFWKNNSVLIVFGISLSGWFYSVYLTYLEIVVIKSICPFCVLSAVMMSLILILTTVRLISKPQSQILG